ncbi:cell wall-binding repeat-containing protein [Clostridium sp. LCP25S3_F10]|uniref:cell wall-binding repeat-containing protein n=1 Tax=Clostridium sp. LCP25S3_F10 TaxID=3438750 RepID=UPI003F91F9EE
MKKTSKALASTAALCLVLSTSSVFAAENTAVAPERLAGANRVDTAIKIAEKSFNNNWKNSGKAILSAAADTNLVDSLAVAPLSYQLEAPILLNDAKDSINAETLKSLKDNNVKTVYIATGEGVISNKAKTQLEKAGFNVERLGGKNRYETAKNILDAFKKEGGKATNVALVSGNGLADALSVAPEAAKSGMPILLTDGKDAVAANLAEVAKAADKVYAIGGNGVISDALVQQLKADRVSGHSRYETNAEVIKKFAGDKEFSKVYIGNGQNSHLVDSLTGSVLAAQSGSPIVLADGSLADATKDALRGKVSDQTGVVALGGEAVVSDKLVKEVTDIATESSPEYVAAEKAVKAYEDAKIGTSEEITAAKALKAPAIKAVEAVKDQAQKDSLNARIVAKDKAISEAEAKMQLNVQSVEAINAKQIKVTFNKEINKDDINNIKINKMSDAKDPSTLGYKLSENEKEVVITADNYFEGNYSVIIENIKEKNNPSKLVKAYSGILTVKDEVKPEIVSIESFTKDKTADSVKVKFSEPVQSPILKIDGENVSAKQEGDITEYVIKDLKLDAEKEHTLEAITLKDVSGNTTDYIKQTFKVTKDANAPKVEISTKSDNKILLTFDKEMKDSTVIPANIKVLGKDLEAVAVTIDAVKEVGDTKDHHNVYAITLPKEIYGSDKDTAKLVVSINDAKLEDILGNKLEGKTMNVEISKDKVAPAITGISYEKDSNGVVTSIIVKSDKELAEGQEVESKDIKIIDKDGVDVSDNFLAEKSNITKNGDKEVKFALKNKTIKSGEYTFMLNADLITDASVSANKNKAKNITVNFGDAEKEEFKLADGAVKVQSINKLTVTYGREVKGGNVTGSATDRNNYRLDGKVLPEGTLITLNANKNEATIVLPEGSISKTDDKARFEVLNVQSKDGNTVTPYTTTVSVEDNINPQLVSAKVVDNGTIILTYDEDMTELDKVKVGKEFEIKEGTDIKQLKDDELKASKVDGFKNQIKLTFGTKTVETEETTQAKTKVTVTKEGSKGTVNGTYTGQTDKIYVVKVTEADVNGNATKVSIDNGLDVELTENKVDLGDGISITLDKGTATLENNDTFTVEATAAKDETTTTNEQITLDLTKDLTIKALVDDKKEGSTIDITDLAGNGQKASDKAITITVAK